MWPSRLLAAYCQYAEGHTLLSAKRDLALETATCRNVSTGGHRNLAQYFLQLSLSMLTPEASEIPKIIYCLCSADTCFFRDLPFC